ncbi:MAG: tRNA (guanine(10)-N(2))-dimethyltransferase [Candidatus Micrarchaeota archaeon]|nr:tRNA (guanine(10)-N(2))-dimethyltransferase [Candidatus Micrarchaeota archaeon]
MNTTEGLAKISLVPGVFFNPKMKISRDITSLWISTLPKLNILVDGFCASGVRGIRYKLENKNVSHLIFFDRSKKAVLNTKKNLKLNNLVGTVFEGNSNKFFCNYQNFDFCEIDPFGSPAPFLDSLFWADYKQKTRFVSITATDSAVLCGAHKNACIKIYGAKPAHNFVCHEVGLRILLSFIAKVAAKYDWAIIPHLSFYSLHFFKVLLEIRKSATAAVSSVNQSNFFYIFCQNCFYQSKENIFSYSQSLCPICNNKLNYFGPIWAGELGQKKILQLMKKNYKKKSYLHSKEMEKFLEIYLQELGLPYFYYDIHKICSKYKLMPQPTSVLVEKLKENGFLASKTIFGPTCLRTNASIVQIVQTIKNL